MTRTVKGVTPQVGGAADLGVDHPQRTIRDYERPPGHHEIHAHWATILIMTRRLARPSIALTQAPPEFSSRL